MKFSVAVTISFLLFSPALPLAGQTADTVVAQESSQITKQKERRARAILRRREANPWFRALDTVERTVGNPLYFGLALMAGGVAFYFLRTSRLQKNQTENQPMEFSGWILIIIAAGAILRLHGLGEKSLDHTEMYVPGIPLPSGISEPPPRISIAETLSWHFHDEPHPPGYYFLMWPWTRIFGTSEFALRLPSALFGIASIWLIFRLLSLTHSRKAALLAAGMLALNGHHIFWSQMARMYAMTCFLGLLSTYLLLRMQRVKHQIAYMAVTFFGVFTEILFWPFLAMQALWAATAHPSKTVLRLQAIVIMLGTPLWAHAVYRSRPSPLAEPSFSFLQHYFAYGFLIHPDSFALDPQNPPLILVIALMLAALILSFLAFGRTKPLVESKIADPGFLATLPIAIGAILTTIGYALLAHARQPRMAKTIFVPIGALFLPWLLHKIRRIGDRRKSPTLLYLLLAFIPPVGIFFLSYRFSLLGTRLFLLFVPFLLILITIGLSRLPAKAFSFTVVALLTAHIYSVVHFHNSFSTPIDYKGLAKQINQRSSPNDAIFAHNKHWAITPFFYYLRDRNLVAVNFQEAKEKAENIFVVHVTGVAPTPQMLEAVKGLRRIETLQQRRAYADVYEK